MSTQNTPPWLPENRLITNKLKEEFLQRYRVELGLEDRGRSVAPSESVDDQIFTALTGGKNWHLWMPKDSVIRMREAEDRYEEFMDIVSETAKSLPTRDELEPIDYYILGDNIISRFNGSTDFDHEQVRGDDFEPQFDDGNRTYDEMPIVVQTINSRNLEDWYVYVISNAPQLFGDEIASMTQAARLIFQNNIEPAQSINNIGFHIEDYTRGRDSSIPGTTAPIDPVAVVENTRYWQIESPRQTFGDDWGTVSRMRRILQENHQDSKFCDNPIGYWVKTGANR